MSSLVTAGGQADVVNEWLSGVQRDHAQILKQGRMLREERASENKTKKEKDKQTPAGVVNT